MVKKNIEGILAVTGHAVATPSTSPFRLRQGSVGCVWCHDAREGRGALFCRRDLLQVKEDLEQGA